MFVVSEADVAAIRTAFEQEGRVVGCGASASQTYCACSPEIARSDTAYDLCGVHCPDLPRFFLDKTD
jgi:hypothetical protein